jgi:hypothetical protein
MELVNLVHPTVLVLDHLVIPMALALLVDLIQHALLVVDMQLVYTAMDIHMEQVVHAVVLDIIPILAIVQIIIKLI